MSSEERPLTAADLASRAGVGLDRVDTLRSSGLLSEQESGGFVPADVGRIAVIEALVAQGLPLESLAEAAATGVVSFAWFEGVLPPPPNSRDLTYEELFSHLGVSIELATSLFEVFGVAKPSLTARVRDDDAVLFEHLSRALAFFGGDGDLLVEGVRYLGDNARRSAESQIAFLRRGVVDPLLASGNTLEEVIETLNPLVMNVIRPGIQQLLLWLNRRHVDAYNMQMLVQMVETALHRAGVEVPRAGHPPAIAFIDLSGYTKLSDEGGDERAAELATTLTDLVRGTVARHSGNVVKYLGDGVMLHFPDPADSVGTAIEIIEEAQRHGLPPARAGINAGPVVFRDGDYFGRTVNVAARIAEYARPQEVLISDAVVMAVESGAIHCQDIGSVALKGLSEPVHLHTVLPG